MLAVKGLCVRTVRPLQLSSLLARGRKRPFIYSIERSFARSSCVTLLGDPANTNEPRKEAHPLAPVFTAASVAEAVVEEDGGSTFFADMVTGPIVSGLESIHEVSGLPWWASIVVSSIPTPTLGPF
jgi:hypothetical protein